VILVDSSAFIEYYRPAGHQGARAAVAAAIAADEVTVNGIIHVEILAFARDEADRERLGSDFKAFHRLELGPAVFDLAADLGFRLRPRGVTVPATDLIIAASAIHSGATLYHLDAHFDRITELGELSARNLGV
jgi:predicted nucleic acid-binding protein